MYCYRTHEDHSTCRTGGLRDVAVLFKPTDPKVGITAGDFHAQLDGSEGKALMECNHRFLEDVWWTGGNICQARFGSHRE